MRHDEFFIQHSSNELNRTPKDSKSSRLSLSAHITEAHGRRLSALLKASNIIICQGVYNLVKLITSCKVSPLILHGSPV